MKNLMKRHLRDATESLVAAQTMIERLNSHGTPAVEDIQTLINAASQATQAAKELNQLSGLLMSQRYTKD